MNAPNELLAALETQPPGPCDDCTHRLRCAAELLACCAYAEDITDATLKGRESISRKAATFHHREPSHEWWLYAEGDATYLQQCAECAKALVRAVPASSSVLYARKTALPSRAMWPRIQAALTASPGEPTLWVAKRIGSSPDGARKRLLELEKVGVVRHELVRGRKGGAPTWRWYLA